MSTGYINLIEDKRALKDLVFDTNERIMHNKRFYFTSIIFPNCCKRIINYLWNTEQYFMKKKDVENHACLLAIRELRKKIVKGQNLVDEHLYLRTELLQENSEPTLDQFDNQFIVDNGYIQESLKNYRTTKRLFVHVFSGANPSNDFYPFQKPSGKPSPYFIGFIIDRDLSYLNMDYQIYQDINQRHIHTDYLVKSEIAKSREEAFNMTQEK